MDEAFQHAGPHAAPFLGFMDRLALRATSRACDAWFRSTLRALDTPIAKPQHWKAFVKAYGSHLSEIKAFPTTVFHMQTVNAHTLRALDLSFCGLTRLNVTRLLPFLKKLSLVQDVSLNYNAELKTEGVVAALGALGTAGAQLRSLSLVSTGLDATFDPVAVPSQLVKSLRQLNLCLNRITDEVIRFLLLRLPHLRRVFVDARDVATAASMTATQERSQRLEAVAFCACDALQARHLMGLPRIRLLALACPQPLLPIESGSVGASLTQLSLMLTEMPADAWKSFFTCLGQQTSLVELVLHQTKGVTGANLATFFTNHREPLKFLSLGVLHAEWFKAEDVRLVLKAMQAQNMRLRKCTLDGCTGFRLEECCAADMAAILDPVRPVYVDLRVPKPLVHALYRQEAAWLEALLSSGVRFSHLGLAGRYLVMDREPAALAGVEHLSLDGTETSWTLSKARGLRTISMSDVQPPHQTLVQQILLGLANFEKLRFDYCHLKTTFPIGSLRHLHTLHMNWCKMDYPFCRAFLEALSEGKMPQLSYLGIRGTKKAFVCLAVAAMQGRGRNCHIDAEGDPWTEVDAHRLRAAFGKTKRGDVGQLTITLSAPAAEILGRCLSGLGVVLSAA